MVSPNEDSISCLWWRHVFYLITGLPLMACFCLAGPDGNPPYRDPYVLRKSETIQGHRLPKGTQVSFYLSDELYSAVLGADAQVNGVDLSSGTYVGFQRSGALSYLKLASPQTIKGIRCHEGEVEFDDNGEFKGCDVIENSDMPEEGGKNINPDLARKLESALNRGDAKKLEFHLAGETNTRDNSIRYEFAIAEGHAEAVSFLLGRNIGIIHEGLAVDICTSPRLTNEAKNRVMLALVSTLSKKKMPAYYGNSMISVTDMLFRSGCFSLVKTFLSPQRALSARDEGGETPLHVAARYGAVDVVSDLLSRNASVDSATDSLDGGGETPLHKAAAKGHLEVVKILVAKGADINRRTTWSGRPDHGARVRRDHQTAWMLACEGGHKAVASYLEAAGANVNIEDAYDQGKLYYRRRLK